MKVVRLASSMIAVLLSAAVALSCGMGRKLESITVSQTVSANGQQVSFVATGTFTKAPVTVTPLPVDWTIGLMAPPPPYYEYTLTTQPYVFNCTTTSAPYLPVIAFAPLDPNAPASGTTQFVVQGGALPACEQIGQSAR